MAGLCTSWASSRGGWVEALSQCLVQAAGARIVRPLARRVRSGGLPTAQAERLDPSNPPLADLVHDPATFILADTDDDGSHLFIGAARTELGPSSPSLLFSMQQELGIDCRELTCNGHAATRPGASTKMEIKPADSIFVRQPREGRDALSRGSSGAGSWAEQLCGSGRSRRTSSKLA